MNFVEDPKGYFLIRLNTETKEIEVAHCKERGKINLVFHGNDPQKLYKEIMEQELISREEHATYLSKELEKAMTCLKEKKEYVQD